MSSRSEASPAAIRQALDNIIASPGFAHAERMERFLRWVVEKALAGQAEAIKEYAIGMEVFDRSPTYDPKIDTIVRVEARRLRRKLQEYYEGPGQSDAVRIEIPGPGYVPLFHAVAQTAHAVATLGQGVGTKPTLVGRLKAWLD